MENQTETYQAKVYCTNCHKIIDHNIPKGTYVLQESCPNCGCRELKVPTKKETELVALTYGN